MCEHNNLSEPYSRVLKFPLNWFLESLFDRVDLEKQRASLDAFHECPWLGELGQPDSSWAQYGEYSFVGQTQQKNI